MKKKASVILAKCKQDKKLYGIRIEMRDDDWVRTWAFRLQEEMAEKEGFDQTNFSGSFYTMTNIRVVPIAERRNVSSADIVVRSAAMTARIR